MAKVCGHHRVHRGLPCPHFYTAIVHFLPWAGQQQSLQQTCPTLLSENKKALKSPGRLGPQACCKQTMPCNRKDPARLLLRQQLERMEAEREAEE